MRQGQFQPGFEKRQILPGRQGQEALQIAQLFDLVEDAVVWVKDCRHRYRWVSRAFLLNYEAAGARNTEPGDMSRILGRTDDDLPPPFQADPLRVDDELTLAGHRTVNQLALVTQPNGVACWCLTTKIPLFDGDGKIVGTAGMTRPLDESRLVGLLKVGLRKVLEHIRDHYATALSNRDLAAMAHMSLRAFERKFLASLHLPPQQYLKKLRLQMASRALAFTGASIAAVAQACGFSNQSHLTREFGRHFGRTPREYREHYRAVGKGFGVFSTNSAAGGQDGAGQWP